ncbi:MAG: DUF4118 domain-containing protein [Stenotrophobium sp.]
MPENAASEPQRPSPEALLLQAQKENRGRLKIFLGAAPGVGKTYEMLSVARRKLLDRVDVVIGVVETHGRAETEAQVDGFEVVPRHGIPYKDRVLQEMDLDAILARRPKLVLVDELAHTNAPGSRHPKRYQDVEELLAAGIDVYSTLNIQHVASLNDVVASITHVQVRETVPDSVLESADDIEVVDLTPDDLIQRLREGKVYHGDAGARALQGYFTPSNLTALRELALRRTAERVDEQLREHRRARGVQQVWAAADRVLVCVNESAFSEDLVRYAKRAADRLNASLLALYLETPRSMQLSEAQHEQVSKTLRLATELGAETMTLPGGINIARTVLQLAREQNITQIVVGKSRRSRLFELMHGSVVRDLVYQSDNITVQVMAEQPRADKAKDTHVRRVVTQSWRWNPPRHFGYAVIYVALATLAGLPIERITHLPNVSLVYLPAVMLSAARFGLLPSLLAAVLSALSYNFFFLPPLYTFTIGDPANALAFVAFLAIAVFTSRLTSRVRAQAEMAGEQAALTAELFKFSRRIAGLRRLDELMSATAAQVNQMLHVQTALLSWDSDALRLRGSVPHGVKLDESDLAAAAWCRDKARVTGRGSDTLPGARWLFLPMQAGSGTVGVLGVRREAADFHLDAQERRLLDALVDLVAIAVERVRLAKDVDQAKMLAETEKMRAAMLTSISHDLRTPLASILGAITSLRSYDKLYDERAREELLTTAQDETERMSRFVNNLLDMTRIDAGALQVKPESCDLHDIVGAVLRRAEKILSHHKVMVSLPSDLPMLMLDFVLMEQVLFNLLDNSAKYAPVGSTITVAAQRHKFVTILSVSDEGPGIPEEERHKVFGVFYRIRMADRQAAGTGLGLAICRGFVQAMGGNISVHNQNSGTGCAFEIELPNRLVVSAVQAIPEQS